MVGVIIAGGFGIAWAFWAASGLSSGVAAAVRIAGAIVGALIVAAAVLRHRAAGSAGSDPSSRSGSMFRSRGYLAWVVVEVIALVGGNVILGASGNSAYVAAWTALVVGVHFIGFGRLFAAMFYWLGAAFVAAAITGAIAGAVSGTRQAVEASTGLIAAASLFVAGASGLLTSLPPDTTPTRR